MLDIIELGNKLDLVKINTSLRDDDKKQKVYSSKVLDKKDKDILVIAMPIYEGKIIPLTVGDKYDACFYAKMGLMQCNVIILKRYKEGALFILEVTPISTFKKVQRREYYRINCRLNMEYTILEDKEKHDNGEGEIPEKIWIKGVIIDLSGGGMRVLTKRKLEKQEKIQVRFLFQTDTSDFEFIINSIVISATLYEKNRELIDLRLEFINIKDNDRDRLIRCIFEEERRNIAQVKG